MGAVFFPLQRCCASRSIFSGKSRSISASSRATRRRGTGLDGKTSDIDLPPMGPLLPENEDSGAVDKITRSEEHTSELQSLMRSSYAVFCLKKKKQKHKTTNRQ